MLLYLSGADIRYSISSDNRKPLVYSLGGHYRWHPNEAYNWSLNGGFRWKPSSNFSLSISTGYMYRRSTGQWIQRIIDPLKLATYGVRYVFSDIHQKTLPIEIRLNWTFNPRLSLQAYVQPYIAVGDYFQFKELAAPYTFHFVPYGQGNSTLKYENGLYRADPDGAGPASSFSFYNPDFNYKSLRGTVVLRWEYRPGSALYLVWTQNRSDYSNPGDLRFGRDIESLFSAQGDNLFLLKFTYRFTI